MGNQPSTTVLVESGTSGSNRPFFLVNRAPGPKPGVLPTAPLPDVVVFVQSERSDLNRRSPVPRTGAITRLRYVLMMCKQPVWESNPSLRLERAVSCADRRTGHVVSLCARTFHAVDWEALESSSPGLQPGARPSQLPVRCCHLGLCLLHGHKKSPMSL